MTLSENHRISDGVTAGIWSRTAINRSGRHGLAVLEEERGGFNRIVRRTCGGFEQIGEELLVDVAGEEVRQVAARAPAFERFDPVQAPPSRRRPVTMKAATRANTIRKTSRKNPAVGGS